MDKKKLDENKIIVDKRILIKIQTILSNVKPNNSDKIKNSIKECCEMLSNVLKQEQDNLNANASNNNEDNVNTFPICDLDNKNNENVETDNNNNDNKINNEVKINQSNRKHDNTNVNAINNYDNNDNNVNDIETKVEYKNVNGNVNVNHSLTRSSNGIDKWNKLIGWKRLQDVCKEWLQDEKQKHKGLTLWNGCEETNRKANSRPKAWLPKKLKSKYNISYNIQFYLNQLAYIGNDGTWYDTATHDISHLCDNIKCFNPAHMKLELKISNDSRKKCKTKVFHCQNCNRKFFYSICNHRIKCCKYIAQSTTDTKHFVKTGEFNHICQFCEKPTKVECKLEHLLFIHRIINLKKQ